MEPRTAAKKRRWFWLNTALAIVILVPALIGFGTKFREFVILLGTDEEGSFTLMPVFNYLVVCFGFLCLFGAAVLHGMFRNIEQPKIDFLKREAALDGDESLIAAVSEQEDWRPTNRIRNLLEEEKRSDA